MKPREAYAARLRRYGWEASQYAMDRIEMKTEGLIAVSCAAELADQSRPATIFSAQEHVVAGRLGIVFW